MAETLLFCTWGDGQSQLSTRVSSKRADTDGLPRLADVIVRSPSETTLLRQRTP